MPDEDSSKPLSLKQLAEFYRQMIEPRFVSLEQDMRSLNIQVGEGFEDLYFKFETLHREYIIGNEQMRRMNARLDRLEEKITPKKEPPVH